MMKTRLNGTERPKKDAGGLRHGLLVLAVLLLTCVLMAGAVSATDLPYSTTPDVLYEITSPGEYTLSEDITAADAGENETLILINADGVTLNGNDYTITGSQSTTKYGIRVASGKQDFTIQNIQTITGVNIAGIWAGSNKSTAWDIGDSHISGVTIGDVIAPGFTPKDKNNPNPVTNLTYGITVYSIEDGSLDVSDVQITGKIHGDGSFGIATHVTNGDLTLQQIFVTPTANIISEWGGGNEDQNGRTYYNVQGILAWAFGTGKVTVSDSTVSGVIKSAKGNAYGIDEQTQSGATGQGLINNCIISAELSGNYAYGIATAVIEDGVATVQNSIVNATLKGSAYSAAIAIFDNVNQVTVETPVSRTATIHGNVLNATYSTGSTMTAFRFYSGNPGTGLTINLKNNKMSGISQPQYFFHGYANDMTSVFLNVENNILQVSTAVFCDAGSTNPSYIGTVADNAFTGGSNKEYFAQGNTESHFTNITWGRSEQFTISGNTSVVNSSTNPEVLTATFMDGKPANEAKWTVNPAGVVILNTSSGSSVSYTPVKIGTTTLTVTSGTVKKDVIITVYNATVPDVAVDVVADAGKVNISIPETSSGLTIVTSPDNSTVSITDESGVSVELTYSDPSGADVTKDGDTIISVNGTVETMVVVYPEMEAPVSPVMSAPANYSLNITMNASNVLVNSADIILPKVDPAFNGTVVEWIKGNNINYNPLVMITASATSGTLEQINNNISGMGINLKFHIPKSFSLENIKALHINGENQIDTAPHYVDGSDSDNWIISIYGSSFSSYALIQDLTPTDEDDKPTSSSSSSDGNMNNAYRVLFNDGSTTLSVVTDLSSGDKLTKPETPVKDGYTFAGWYKDSACTQGWDFETGIPGDMTLYAKWTAAGSSGETEATATPTKTATAVTTPQPTKTQTAAATTSAPQATTAAGVSPTLTQAPAPVAGALFGLLAAGVLLIRRFQ